MNLDIAVKYVQNGFAVIPLFETQGDGCSCGKSGCKVGKHPRIAEWQRASCDEGTVAGWWTRWPHANIGLRLDDLAVLDVDGPSGFDSLDALEKRHEILFAGAEQRTGSGGKHYLFQAVEGVGKRIGFRTGLDFLTGSSSYIVCEPSLHASGGTYHWVDTLNPANAHRDKLSLTPPPAWLLEAIAKQAPKPASRATRPAGERVPAERIMAKALEKAKADERRNDAGIWFFSQLRDNRHSKEDAERVLEDWVSKVNTAVPGKHKYTLEEATLSLESAYHPKRAVRDPWPEGEKPSQADILLKLTDDFEYFKSGPGNDGYVRMAVGDHKEVWRVDSRSPKVREILTHRFLTQRGRAPSREALNTVIDTVLAKCSMGPRTAVNVRFARSREVIYLDMADDQWRAIEVTKDGWQVVKEPPVLFRRGAGARPLPVPVKGGTLDSLRPLLNAGDDSQWCLMMSWLVGTFLPDGAFSHLVLNGEQGSAKSTTALVLLSMLDPSDAGLSSPPKDEVDATVSAMHAGILAYDNLSGCRAELADVFCRFSTGQGYRTRTLYENLGITVASVKLPIMLNGIDATVMRGDLLERSITLKLPLVTSKTRLTEQGIWADFTALHPACLGALLDAVSAGLRNLPTTTVTDSPRMSDFCKWIVACESALPWKPGTFLAAYRNKMRDANEDLAENDGVASALIEWVERQVAVGEAMALSSRDLLIHLNEITLGYPKDIRYWPASPEALSHRLVRLSPVLRAQSIEVRKLKRTTNTRSRWEIRRTGPQLPLFIEQDGLKNAA